MALPVPPHVQMQRISNALVIAATFRIARAAGASLRHGFLASINSLCQYGSHNRYVFAKAGAVDAILAWLVEVRLLCHGDTALAAPHFERASQMFLSFILVMIFFLSARILRS